MSVTPDGRPSHSVSGKGKTCGFWLRFARENHLPKPGVVFTAVLSLDISLFALHVFPCVFVSPRTTFHQQDVVEEGGPFSCCETANRRRNDGLAEESTQLPK